MPTVTSPVMTDVDAEPSPLQDPLRERLLDAAARVFAEQGYAGTKVQDIVRLAGLSTGAVYGRFGSKNDLLREAVISRTTSAERRRAENVSRVADLMAEGAGLRDEPLADHEAVRLEAYVTARREPEVAAALAEVHDRWRQAMQPLVEAAIADGTIDEGVDPEAVIFLVRTLHLGMLLHRGSGLPSPDPEAWEALVRRLLDAIARPPD
jgi:AcrR family transcriptional regulator